MQSDFDRRSFDNESPLNADSKGFKNNGPPVELDSSNDLGSNHNNLGIDPNASGFSGLGSEIEQDPGDVVVDGQRNFSTNFNDYKMDEIINTPASKTLPANKGLHPMFAKKFIMVDKDDMLKRSKEAKVLMQAQIGNRIKELY